MAAHTSRRRRRRRGCLESNGSVLRSRARRQFERGRLVRGRKKKGERKEEENKEKYRNREWERNIDARIIPSRYIFYHFVTFSSFSIFHEMELSLFEFSSYRILIKIIIVRYLYI